MKSVTPSGYASGNFAGSRLVAVSCISTGHWNDWQSSFEVIT